MKKESKRDLVLALIGGVEINGKLYSKVSKGCFTTLICHHSSIYQKDSRFFIKVEDIQITPKNNIKLIYRTIDKLNGYKECDLLENVTINPKEGLYDFGF